MLEIRGLSKTYRGAEGPVRALDDVSLKVEGGEFVAVQGSSGCGKTTLLLSAGGLLAPDGGEVLVDGKNPYALGPEKRAGLRASKIGFVFQQFHLIPYLSVLDNVLVPLLAHRRAHRTAHRGAEAPASPPRLASSLERARELIAQFNLVGRGRHVPAELSTGERQRTALARALLGRPKLLLADEPTGNLDRGNSDVVLGCMREFAEGGGAVLLVTHDPQAAGYAGRVLHLEDGRLGCVGPKRTELE